MIILGLAGVFVLCIGATLFIRESRDRIPWKDRGWPKVHMNHPLVRQWRMPFWVTIAWGVFLGLLSLVAGVAKQLDDGLDDDTWDWIHEPKTQLWIGVSFAMVVFVDSVRRVWSHVGSAKETGKRKEIQKQLRSVVATVSDQTGIKAGDIGCGLFLVHNSWRCGTRLIRVERERLLNTVSESGVTFRPGIGTVGDSWKTKNQSYHDWTGVNKKYHSNPPSLQSWNKIQEKTKHGFDYESWKVMVGRYSEVLAFPITVNGEMIGVLAVDRKWHDDEPDPSPLLNKRPLKTSVAFVVSTLVPLLGGTE